MLNICCARAVWQTQSPATLLASSCDCRQAWSGLTGPAMVHSQLATHHGAELLLAPAPGPFRREKGLLQQAVASMSFVKP